MALWQWNFWLVPKKDLQKHFSVLPEYIDQHWFESMNHWDTVAADELVVFFDTLLPKYDTPWATNTRSWGSDDGDRIELSIDNGTITDLFVRFDLRKPNLHFLRELVDFARANALLVYALESTKLIESQYDEVQSQIRTSRKMLFVTDPERFFADREFLEKIDSEARRKLEK